MGVYRAIQTLFLRLWDHLQSFKDPHLVPSSPRIGGHCRRIAKIKLPFEFNPLTKVWFSLRLKDSWNEPNKKHVKHFCEYFKVASRRSNFSIRNVALAVYNTIGDSFRESHLKSAKLHFHENVRNQNGSYFAQNCFYERWLFISNFVAFFVHSNVWIWMYVCVCAFCWS